MFSFFGFLYGFSFLFSGLFSFQTINPTITPSIDISKRDFRLHSLEKNEYPLDKRILRRFSKQSIKPLRGKNPLVGGDTQNMYSNERSHFYIIQDLYIHYYNVDEPIIVNVGFVKHNFTSFDHVLLRPDFIEKCIREQLRPNIPILLFFHSFMHPYVGSIYKKNIEMVNQDNGKSWVDIQKIWLIETRQEIFSPVDMYGSLPVDMHGSLPVDMHGSLPVDMHGSLPVDMHGSK